MACLNDLNNVSFNAATSVLPGSLPGMPAMEQATSEQSTAEPFSVARVDLGTESGSSTVEESHDSVYPARSRGGGWAPCVGNEINTKLDTKIDIDAFGSEVTMFIGTADQILHIARGLRYTAMASVAGDAYVGRSGLPDDVAAGARPQRASAHLAKDVASQTCEMPRP